MLPMTDVTHHESGPKELGLDPEKKSVMSVDIARTTNHTGEQIHIAVPIYSDDDREAVIKRMGFAFSIIQDRMEQENKAVAFVNERNETIRRCAVIIDKNEQHLKKEIERIAKDLKRKRIDDAMFEKQREKLVEDCRRANEKNVADMKHAEAEIAAARPLPREAADGEVGPN